MRTRVTVGVGVGVGVLVVALLGAAPVDYSNYQERWVTPPKVEQKLLSHRTYRSAAMGVDVGYNLYLPPGYGEPENAAKRYPVIYWLHGLNQSESTDQFPPAVLDGAVRSGSIGPVIVVYVSGGSRTFYSDSPDGKILSETTIVKELIPHVDQTYRTIARREGRAISGMSMGGFGALKLACTYPELFSSVVAYAPSLRTPENLLATHPDVVKRMYGGDPKRFWAQHPSSLFKERADALRGKMPVAFFIGDQDRLLEGDRRLHALLEELKIEHVYEEVAGADHNLVKLVEKVKDRGLQFTAKHFGDGVKGK
jgi:enterochelin esterase-like enzyme